MLGTITRKRDMLINKALLLKRPTLLVYNGKSYAKVTLTTKMMGHKVGEFSLTKKLGSKIHDSTRNRKRKNKKKHK